MSTWWKRNGSSAPGTGRTRPLRTSATVTRDRWRRLRRRELDEGAPHELTAYDGGALEHRPLVRFEQVEPAVDQRLHRGRHVLQCAGPVRARTRRAARRRAGFPLDLDDALVSSAVSSPPPERREQGYRVLLGQGREQEACSAQAGGRRAARAGEADDEDRPGGVLASYSISSSSVGSAQWTSSNATAAAARARALRSRRTAQTPSPPVAVPSARPTS